MDFGFAPTAKTVAAPKFPLPSPSNTEILFDELFAVTRSRWSSLLKSPAASAAAPTAPDPSGHVLIVALAAGFCAHTGKERLKNVAVIRIRARIKNRDIGAPVCEWMDKA